MGEIIPIKELKKPIIFFGTGRTGTSVISEIVMRHQNLAFPSQYQNKIPSSKTINLLRRLFDNRFWRIHGQKKQLNKVSFFNRLAFKPVEAYTMWNYITETHINFSRDFLLHTSASDHNIKKIRSYFSAMVKKQGKKRLAFKITGPARLEFLLSIFPDAQVVRIHREIIPTISSFAKVGFWKSRGYDKLWWIGAYSNEEQNWADNNADNPIAMTAFQIKKVIESSNKEVKKLNPILLNVHYETFIQDPEKCINKILSFLELAHDESCYTYLHKNKIFNRNKKKSDYFNQEEIDVINTVLNTSFPQG